MAANPIPVLAGIAPLAGRYDAWLCDVWGVVHNGVRPYPEAADALARFRASGGRVLLLTNSPRPSGPVLAQLAKIGVPKEAFDAVVTSGDATRHELAGLGPTPVLHIGPRRDRALFADLDLNVVGEDEARVALCTGLVEDGEEALEDYDPMLARLAGRDATMICANPDLVIDHGGRMVPCAGALAARYEALGGRTVYAGKPHPPIYGLAFERLEELTGTPLPRERMLAIGDGLATDIAGAAAAGLAALFIVGGIHTAEVADGAGRIDPARLVRLFEGLSVPPIAALSALRW